jgi:glyoxylase-like metal-dependent hydrolase (beta-lactamase superfamily II)
MDAVKIGDATVTRIEETYEPNFDAAKFFSDWRPEIVQEHRDWMLPNHFDPASGMIKLSVHSWLITVGGKRILIDGCVGNHKPRPLRTMWDMMNTPYLERLAAAGVKPEQVDIVMCTHLHMDHVGWNTRLENGRWVPTFPNAKYVFSRADYDHYLKLDSDPATGPVNQGSFRDSVIPIVEARLSQMVDGAHTVDEHLSLDPRPGHTPGTVAINLASRGQKALFCGDILHHAIQVYHPEWNSFACADQVNARKSRRQVLEDCAGSGALLMPAHFGAPFVCRVDHKGESFTPRFGA